MAVHAEENLMKMLTINLHVRVNKLVNDKSNKLSNYLNGVDLFDQTWLTMMRHNYKEQL